MNLETLTLRGVRSFRNEQTIDFQRKSLVGILGDTGAGKSTILEAIVFALYGQSSWANQDTGKYASLITDGEDALKVVLVFGHDGERWKVTRTGGRSMNQQALLENLDTDRKHRGVTEVNAQITRLLGMTLTAFLSVVLLAQGEFDRLLNARPSERPKILQEILDSETLTEARRQAEGRFQTINELIHEAQLARARLLEDPVRTAQDKAGEAERAEQRGNQLDTILGEARSRQAELSAARTRAARLKAAYAELTGLDEISGTDELTPLIALAESFDREAADLSTKQQAATDRSTEIETEIAALADVGLTEDSVTLGDSFLSSAPKRIADLRAHDEELNRDRASLQARDVALERRNAEVEQHESAAKKAAAAAPELENRQANSGDAYARLEETVGASLTAGENLEQTRLAVQHSKQTVEARNGAVRAWAIDLESKETAHTTAVAGASDAKLVKDASLAVDRLRDSIHGALSAADAEHSAAERLRTSRSDLSKIAAAAPSIEGFAELEDAVRRAEERQREIGPAGRALQNATSAARTAIGSYFTQSRETDLLSERLRNAREEILAAKDRQDQTRAAAREAHQKLDAATERRNTVLRDTSVSTLVAGLRPGHDACPVCAAILPEDFAAPTSHDAAMAKTADTQVRKAERALAAADGTVADAEKFLEQTKTLVASLEGDLPRATEHLAALLEPIQAAWNAAAEAATDADAKLDHEPAVLKIGVLAAAERLRAQNSDPAVETAGLIRLLTEAADDVAQQQQDAHNAREDAVSKLHQAKNQRTEHDARLNLARTALAKAEQESTAAEAATSRSLGIAGGGYTAAVAAFASLEVTIEFSEQDFRVSLVQAIDVARAQAVAAGSSGTAAELLQPVLDAHEVLGEEVKRGNELLSEARHQRDEAKRGVERAESELTDAKTEFEQQKRTEKSATMRLTRALARSTAAYGSFLSVCIDTIDDLDTSDAFDLRLRNAAAQREPQDDIVARTRDLLGKANRAIESISDRSSQMKAEAARLTGIAAGERRALDEETKALVEARTAHNGAVKFVASAWRDFTLEANALPPAIRMILPDSSREATDAELGRARTATKQHGATLRQFRLDLGATQKALNAGTEKQLELERRLDTEVGRTLRNALRIVRKHRDAVVGCASLCVDPPPTPIDEVEETDPRSVQRFVAAVSEYHAVVRDALETHSSVAQHDLAGIQTVLTGLRERVRSIDADVDLDDDLADLESLIIAVSEARRAARESRTAERGARDQIDRASALDNAIKAGGQRREALKIVKENLTNAKFLSHLTERRTRDLLGAASELFEELSEGQFGFAERFQIASIPTQTARDPKTLSGGETFLASLALALAMVEIYGHRGPRLGTLFLDEGFGALDTASLETALAVLRKHVGEDRLVVVISHLRPVAEAVQHVLLTERTSSSSVARWLDSEQLGRFLYEENEGGLLTPH